MGISYLTLQRRTQNVKTHNRTIQKKIKKMSNTDPTKKPGVNSCWQRVSSSCCDTHIQSCPVKILVMIEERIICKTIHSQLLLKIKATVKFSFKLTLTVARKTGFDESWQRFQIYMMLMLVIKVITCWMVKVFLTFGKLFIKTTHTV